MKALTSILVGILLLSCDGNSAPEAATYPEEFGSAEAAKMAQFAEQLGRLGIPFKRAQREGITVFSWRSVDDERVRPILCAIFPLPPPGDRSVAMASPQATKMLEQALHRRGIAYETQEFIGARYLIFDRQDLAQVRSLFIDTFGYPMVQGPPLDSIAELMGCHDRGSAG